MLEKDIKFNENDIICTKSSQAKAFDNVVKEVKAQTNHTFLQPRRCT